MTTERKIVARTGGQTHGPITRLMSPGDLGHLLKPFIFLDYVEAEGSGPQFGFHPHSGIATLTFPLTFDIEHTTSEGQVDVVRKGGVEWVMTGSGIWHKARGLHGDQMRAFQTWFAMPPSHELATPSAQFVQADEVPRSGPVTLLLGKYQELASKITPPFDVSYLWVELKAGESWTYQPSQTHDIAWLFPQTGTVGVSGSDIARELVVFEEGHASIVVEARTDCRFLLGSAAKLPQSLAMGYYSVHSSEQHLILGERRIKEIGASLKS